MLIKKKHNKHSSCHMHTSILMSREGWGDSTFTRSAESSCGYRSMKTTALVLFYKHERGINILVMSDFDIRGENMPHFSLLAVLIWPIITQTKQYRNKSASGELEAYQGISRFRCSTAFLFSSTCFLLLLLHNYAVWVWLSYMQTLNSQPHYLGASVWL